MLSKFSSYSFQARNPHLGTTLVWDFGKSKEIEAIEKLLKEVEVACLGMVVAGGCCMLLLWLLVFFC